MSFSPLFGRADTPVNDAQALQEHEEFLRKNTTMSSAEIHALMQHLRATWLRPAAQRWRAAVRRRHESIW